MFIACKYEEVYYPSLSDFTYITSNSYTEQEVIEMEDKMLKALGYTLGAPASLHFLRRYSRMAEVNTQYTSTNPNAVQVFVLFSTRG